jgi:hypothetical protein
VSNGFEVSYTHLFLDSFFWGLGIFVVHGIWDCRRWRCVERVEGIVECGCAKEVRYYCHCLTTSMRYQTDQPHIYI